MNKYELERVIGEGSFGKALLCKRRKDSKRCLVKQIPLGKMTAKEAKQTELEASLLSRLDHPNIVAFWESFVSGSNLYIVMEFANGGDLDQFLKKRNGCLLSEDEILQLLVQIALALKHTHDRKILHRDLKPGNIFLTSSGLVKLGDFGVSRILQSTYDFASTQIGTPYYMSPEIIESEKYNSKTDVWSLGCILYEIIHLKVPFSGKNIRQLSENILTAEPIISHPTIGTALKDLVKELLTKNCHVRPGINAILSRPVMKERIALFLDASQRSSEFGHSVIHGLKVLKKSVAPVPTVPKAPPMGPIARNRGKYTGITGINVSPYEETESEKHDRELAGEKEREIERGRANLMNRIKEADEVREKEKEKKYLTKGGRIKKTKCVEFATQNIQRANALAAHAREAASLKEKVDKIKKEHADATSHRLATEKKKIADLIQARKKIPCPSPLPRSPVIPVRTTMSPQNKVMREVKKITAMAKQRAQSVNLVGAKMEISDRKKIQLKNDFIQAENSREQGVLKENIAVQLKELDITNGNALKKEENRSEEIANIGSIARIFDMVEDDKIAIVSPVPSPPLKPLSKLFSLRAEREKKLRLKEKEKLESCEKAIANLKKFELDQEERAKGQLLREEEDKRELKQKQVELEMAALRALAEKGNIAIMKNGNTDSIPKTPPRYRSSGIFEEKEDIEEDLLKSPNRMKMWMADLAGKTDLLNLKVKNMQDHPLCPTNMNGKGRSPIVAGNRSVAITVTPPRPTAGSHKTEKSSEKKASNSIETVSESFDVTMRGTLRNTGKMSVWMNNLAAQMDALHNQVKILQEMPHIFSPLPHKPDDNNVHAKKNAKQSPESIVTPPPVPVPFRSVSVTVTSVAVTLFASPPIASVKGESSHGKKGSRTQMKDVIAKMREQNVRKESVQGLPKPPPIGTKSPKQKPNLKSPMPVLQQKKATPLKTVAEKKSLTKPTAKATKAAEIKPIKNIEQIQSELKAAREKQRREFKSFLRSKRAQQPSDFTDDVHFEVDVAFKPRKITRPDSDISTSKIVSDSTHSASRNLQYMERQQAFQVPSDVNEGEREGEGEGEGEGEREEEGEGEGEGDDGTSIEGETDSGKESQATIRQSGSPLSNLVDCKTVTRQGGWKDQRGLDRDFQLEVMSANESQKGYYDNFDVGNDNDEGKDDDISEDESESSSVALSPFIFTDYLDENNTDCKRIHRSAKVAAAYEKLHAEMQSISSLPTSDHAEEEEEMFGDEEEVQGESGDGCEEVEVEVEETGEGIVQWVEAEDSIEVDEGEQSDGSDSPRGGSSLDLAALSVRLSSRSEEERARRHNNQMIPDEILLFGPTRIPNCITPRGAMNIDDIDDVITDISTTKSPLRRMWVAKTVDLDNVVEDLQVALTAEELRTINTKKKLKETSTKVVQLEVLRKALHRALGVDAVNDASLFLRSVSTMQVEDSVTSDDEYLLSRMEEIVGADGLQYMNAIYSLITIEDEIERDKIELNEYAVRVL